MMLECHQKYPQYNFAKHKGYGTKEHQRAIEKFGICELHRKTFRGVKEYL
jgi:ribonuclease HII